MFKMINVQLPPVATAPDELMDQEIPVYCDSSGKCCGGVCCYLVLWEKEKKRCILPPGTFNLKISHFSVFICMNL